MRSLEEGPLRCSTPNELTIRFMWLRTFHAPVLVRLAGPPWVSKARVTDGHGGYEPGVVVHREARELSEDEREHLLQSFEALDFWSRELAEPKAGCDGAHWILEAATPTKYRMIDEWSPERGVLRDFCLDLLRCTTIDLSDVY